MPLSLAEKEQLFHDLSSTPFASASLTLLSGGTANFVFRGTLPKRTIVVKHSTGFASCNRDFPLDISRCIFENAMLNALHGFSHQVKTPHAYLLKGNTQVHQDFPGDDLKLLILSLPQSTAISIGHSLGSWAKSFHTWSSTQTLLRNEPMQKLKHSVTYDSFIKIVERFPNVIQDRATLEEVKNMATKELQSPTEDWGTIHGDFWTGNVLVFQNSDLFVIDWELAQLGHRAYDLGQMIGDLIERKYFKDAVAAPWVMEGFINGYGTLSDDMAFRTAIHTGIHLIGWCNRGPAKDTQERMEGIVRMGMDFVLKGWKKDKKWFGSSVLAALFQNE